MNWKWHFYAILNIFFLSWFGFNCVSSLREGMRMSFIMWLVFTFWMSYCLVNDWVESR